MPSIRKRRELKAPKVIDNGLRIPEFQSVATAGMDGYYTIPMTPQPSSSSLGSGASLYFDLERDECAEINDIIIRLTVSCANASVTAVNPYYWFKRIVIESEKGSGDELAHIYPEQFMLWNYLLQGEESRQKWAKLSNYASVKLNGDKAEKFYDSESTKFQVGDSREIYLQIPVTFFHLDALDMKHIRSDLRIRMELASDIIVSGDRTNLSLDNIHLLINSFQEESYDRQDKEAIQKSYTEGYIYCDVERLQINDKTLTSGQTTKFNLDQFVGKCPFLLIVVKPSASPSASDRSLYNYVELGDDSEFDITNSSSQSLYGHGTPIKQQQLYEVFTSQTGNPHVKGVYLIPFCEDVKKALSGAMNGIFDFYGLRDYLEITFGSAPTQEVQTISLGTTASSGTYRYAFENGVISDQDLDYDDSASDIKAVIDAIPQLEERDISVTVNDGLNNTTSQTITFNNNAGRVCDELGKIAVLNNTDAKVNSTSVTTYGKRGFVTGSDYQVEIFMYKYKCLKVDKKGNLNCHDL